MLAVQPRLPLVLAQRPRQRRVRRSFHPSQGQGAYRLPREVQDRLTVALAPFRNRESAFALAIFIARFWSVPGRVTGSFPIDRRALVEHDELELTERQIRSAIRVLEEIGFLDRAVASGSKYKATEEGLRKKPILFQFGSEYFPLFDTANKLAAARREQDTAAARTKTLLSSRRASTVNSEAQTLKCPKNKNPSERTVLMGHVRKESGLPAQTFDPDPQLEAALARFEEGFRRSRGG